ncbi:hypothetical protein C8R47DRAFT_1327093 [Mycena vitilis]|nr:hypothetical protein C8R47DRAFT_1329987 [Mycena vitilis]KAJ6462751.1 hypothetical protein C8R47DRAFT_1327093 [Mycena vitilis]
MLFAMSFFCCFRKRERTLHAEVSVVQEPSRGWGMRERLLPRKRGLNFESPCALFTMPRREASDEVETWLQADGSHRHQDGGPVPTANLGRSESGRLPPAYGEQIANGA